MTRTYNITRGDRFYDELEFQIYSGTGELDDDSSYLPIDLTLITDLKMQVRDKKDRTGTLMATLTLLSGLTIDPLNTNILKVRIPSTEEWKDGTYYGGLRFEYLDKEYETYMDLVIIVKEGPTV